MQLQEPDIGLPIYFMQNRRLKWLSIYKDNTLNGWRKVGSVSFSPKTMLAGKEAKLTWPTR